MTKAKWLHMGASNIFRVFIAAVQQDLIEAGLADSGIAVCECYDGEIIPTVFAPYNNETMAVILNTDGTINKRRITSVTDAFGHDQQKLNEIIADPELQIISFTITEKGYAITPEQVCHGPQDAVSALECVAAGLFARFEAGAPPLALVAMDNFAANGTKLAHAMQIICITWYNNKTASGEFCGHAASHSYPWTMIDKITPFPSEAVAKILADDGFPHTQIVKTAKNTVIAPFVNAESCQYLVMEDNFPNGRPPFEKLIDSGVYLTNRETVRKVDHMKVCACLNPLHTILGLGGMLLNYPTISACMQDESLVALVRKSAEEALPVVAHPGIIDPEAFLEEVLTVRFPNPFIPDTPGRIVTDSSQKIPVRFGQTLMARKKASLPNNELKAIPMLVALWLRYRMGIDDGGKPLTLSPDPLIPGEIAVLEGLPLGSELDLRPILTNCKQFGVDLCQAGLGDKICELFAALSKEAGAVKRILAAY
jgi:fructuronate reductase